MNGLQKFALDVLAIDFICANIFAGLMVTIVFVGVFINGWKKL